MRRDSGGRLICRLEVIALLEDEAATCRGGGENPIQQLLDWITGTPPKPDQWPPQIA